MANLFPDPPIKTIPASPFITATTFTVSTLGPRQFGGALWGAGYVSGPEKGSVIKSTDGGLTWAQVDQTNAPVLASQGVLDIVFDATAGIIHFLGYTTHMIYAAFDMNAGTWGAPVDSGLVAGFFKFGLKSDGDLVVVYYESDALAAQRLMYLILSAGVFGAPAQLLAGVAATSWVPCSLLVDSVDTVHAIVQTSNSGTAAVQALYHASVDTGGGTTGPDLIDGPPPIQPFNHVQSEIGVGGILGTSLLWAWIKITGLIAPFTYTVTVYKGTPLAAPVWTVHSGPVYVGSFQQYSASATFRAHIVINNGVANIFWFKQAADDSVRLMQYCTFDGSAFGSALDAWDALTDPASGDPIAGASIDAFSVTAKDDTFRALVDEFVTPGYDQTLVLLDAPAVPPPVDCEREQDFSITVYPKQYLRGNSEQLVCDIRYPWLVPPEQRTPWKQDGSISTPALNVVSLIWAYQIPDGFYLVLDRIFHTVDPLGLFIGGSGSLIWLIDVNSPIGSPQATWRPVAQFTGQIGSVKKGPFPVGPLQFRGGDVLRYKVVVTDPLVPVGPPNVISATAEGWLYPVARSL